MASTFLIQRGSAKSAGIEIIRNIFKTQSFPDGVTTKQLYKLALKEPAPPDFQPYPLGPPPQPKAAGKKNGFRLEGNTYPPNPSHPVRSIGFLKKEILVAMKEANEISTVRQPKASAKLAEEAVLAENATKREWKAFTSSQVEFVWKLAHPKKERPPPEVKEVVGREVGVGADISHLNKRRQRARIEKVNLSVLKMKAIKQGLKARPLEGRPYYRVDKLNADQDAASP